MIPLIFLGKHFVVYPHSPLYLYHDQHYQPFYDSTTNLWQKKISYPLLTSTITVPTLVTFASTGVLNLKNFFQDGPQSPEAFSILSNGIHTVVFPVLVFSLRVSVPHLLVPICQIYQFVYSFYQCPFLYHPPSLYSGFGGFGVNIHS